ncbi:outer membrane beta-barrel protein [Aquimarina spongiae]|uniref:Outer membrane protein beta-barrel domain-containing protein n=1 Tax=Aquimarina spongiae TaxID=570521 RepID=A0A1M6F2X2_9FLAO|nr:outer membrane beta-barrel protein [Aquimarina spongiae]SHI92023.1 Outer membrane protein beta-barrel domain-containing protein [Aquimarina spongiae]
MSDKKNIDRLFQEKFKDFDVTPDESVWEKIKARKDDDRKRAFILPLWYKVGGVAAVAAILIAIGYFSLTERADTHPTLVKSETKETPSSPIDSTTNYSIPNTTVVSSDEGKENLPEPKTSQEDETQTSSSNPITTSQKREAVDTKLPKENRYTTPKGSSYSQTQNAIVEQTSDQKTNTAISEKEENSLIAPQDPSKATTGLAENQHTDPKTTTQESNAKPLDSNSVQDSKRIADNTTIDNNEGSNEKSIDEDVKTTTEEPVKKSIFDAIAENEEDIEATEESGKKWTVAPNVAPVYYNSVGNGSSIDRQFADNEKSGQVNLSYGVQVAYEINKRFSIRSGVHKVDLSYNTLDVGFSPSATGQNISSIDYAPSAQAILVSDIGTQDVPGFNASEVNRDAINQRQNAGLLNQRIGYIEVPLEMKYAIVDRKVGVNMIGGVSTLFLEDNEISLEAGDFETEIGQANNLNEVSFSGNIGIGIDYKLSDQFQINLEPIFKYQFNAFNDAGDFRPFYFGVYTGMSIKF